jgi:flagellar biogenesis protein FliO
MKDGLTFLEVFGAIALAVAFVIATEWLLKYRDKKRGHTWEK